MSRAAGKMIGIPESPTDNVIRSRCLDEAEARVVVRVSWVGSPPDGGGEGDQGGGDDGQLELDRVVPVRVERPGEPIHREADGDARQCQDQHGDPGHPLSGCLAAKTTGNRRPGEHRQPNRQHLDGESDDTGSDSRSGPQHRRENRRRRLSLRGDSRSLTDSRYSWSRSGGGRDVDRRRRGLLCGRSAALLLGTEARHRAGAGEAGRGPAVAAIVLGAFAVAGQVLASVTDQLAS